MCTHVHKHTPNSETTCQLNDKRSRLDATDHRSFPGCASLRRATLAHEWLCDQDQSDFWTAGQTYAPHEGLHDAACSVQDAMAIQLAPDEVTFLRDLIDRNRSCADCLMKCRSSRQPFRICADRCAVRSPQSDPNPLPAGWHHSVDLRCLADVGRQLAKRGTRAGTRTSDSDSGQVTAACLHASLPETTDRL